MKNLWLGIRQWRLSIRSADGVPGGGDGGHSLYSNEMDDASLRRAMRVTGLATLAIAALLLWAYFAEVVEVSTGDGRVIPISREQVIQSLEGGILLDLMVREGDIVEADQILAQMDLTKTESNVEESASRYRATLASVARLEAEANGTPLAFPAELDDSPALVASEKRLYQTRRDGLSQTLAGVSKSLALVREELNITES